MKTQSIYSLLVQSQEKGRSIFETAVYAIVILSTVAAVFQSASQAVIVPAQAAVNPTSAAIVAKADVLSVPARS